MLKAYTNVSIIINHITWYYDIVTVIILFITTFIKHMSRLFLQQWRYYTPRCANTHVHRWRYEYSIPATKVNHVTFPNLLTILEDWTVPRKYSLEYNEFHCCSESYREREKRGWLYVTMWVGVDWMDDRSAMHNREDNTSDYDLVWRHLFPIKTCLIALYQTLHE